MAVTPKRIVLTESITYVDTNGNELFTIDPRRPGVIIPASTSALLLGTAPGISGVGAYKVARGVHLQAAASDTIVTGLTTVVAVVVSFQDAPTANIFAVAGDIGDQAGTPAAGSFLLKAYKTPATPTAATTFSDNVHVAWTAIGT